MNPDNLISEVISCARETGAYIASQRDNISLAKAEYKGLNDLVTEVDKESEKRISEFLESIFPEAEILAEENRYEKKSSEYRWVIDPLDGTTNFVHGIPAYTISIALLEREKPVLGVVYDVERKECFAATKNAGTWLNDKRVEVSKSCSLQECLMATGFPVTVFDKTSLLLKITEAFIKNTQGVRRIGSAALDLAYVSCGRFDGFFEYNLNAWDVAAGALLVTEAGGKVSDFSGGENYIYGREILAGNLVHPEMQKLIFDFWDKK